MAKNPKSQPEQKRDDEPDEPGVPSFGELGDRRVHPDALPKQVEAHRQLGHVKAESIGCWFKRTFLKWAVVFVIILTIIGYVSTVPHGGKLYLKADRWSDPIPVGKSFHCDIEYGIGYTVMANDDETMNFRRESTDTSRIVFPSNTLITRIRIKPDRDMKVTIISK